MIKSRQNLHVILILCSKAQYINLWCSLTFALKLHTELEWLLINTFGKHMNSYAFVNLQICSANSTIAFVLLSLWLLLSLFDYHCYHYFHYYCCHTTIIWSVMGRFDRIGCPIRLTERILEVDEVIQMCFEDDDKKPSKFICSFNIMLKITVNLGCSITLHWNYIQNLNDC